MNYYYYYYECNCLNDAWIVNVEYPQLWNTEAVLVLIGNMFYLLKLYVLHQSCSKFRCMTLAYKLSSVRWSVMLTEMNATAFSNTFEIICTFKCQQSSSESIREEMSPILPPIAPHRPNSFMLDAAY